MNLDRFILALCIMGARYFRIFSIYFRLKEMSMVGADYFIKWAEAKPMTSIIER